VRVARIITRLNRGGPARTLLSVEPLLARHGVESLLLTGEPARGEDDLTDEFRRAGVALRIVPGLRRSPSPLDDVGVVARIERELAAFRPDVIHTHTFKAGCAGRLARAPGDVRRVHTFHGHLFEGAFPRPFGALLAWIERRLARRTDLVLAVSERVRADLCERWGVAARDRTEVLPGVLLPELAHPADETERAAARARTLPAIGPWVGTLARLARIKAPLFFLEVAERVVAARQSARFVWVGDGEMRERFLSAIARRRLSESVRWVGWQSDVRPWHLALDVEVLLSDQEGLPLSLVEARSLGVPIVATDVGGVAEILRAPGDGRVGRLVPARDAAAASGAIVELLDALSSGGGARSSAPRDPIGLAPDEHARRLVGAYVRTLARPPIRPVAVA
jgi:glycosyltransferase involved in cell wall biosynthesis